MADIREQTYELKSRSKQYVDISLAFIPSPLKNDITTLKNERAINNAIKNIVLFIPGEVPFDRDVGSHTSRYLFDTVDDITGGALKMEIERAILFGEPRVTFDNVDPLSLNVSQYTQAYFNTTDDLFLQDDLGVFVNARPDQNAFDVTVKYRIVGDQKIYRFQEILTPTRF